MTDLVIPEDGMQISRDTTFAPGVYYLPKGIEIVADDVTLDGNGALLIGNNFMWRGVSVNQRRGVTIKNICVERYYHGIWVNASTDIHIEHCRVTRTHELPSPDTFLDVWLPRNEAYGGGIFLSGVTDSFVTDNDVQHQQSGVMLYGCNNVQLLRNNASYNSGYGILLFESSENKIDSNVADYCCRVYQSNPNSEIYDNGADAAALVVMCCSSKNIVTKNMFRSGGDGVFLGGFHKDQLIVSCNDNVFEHNDCCDSPNIAFEATFSARNVFRNNKASNCNFGFWLGWSSENTVENNSIRNNRIAGIAIEHGRQNKIENNIFEKNREGVQLWVNPDKKRGAGLFRQFFPDNTDSHETVIRKNKFTRHDTAIHCWTDERTLRCHHFTIYDNDLSDNRVAVLFERVRDSTISENRIVGNVEAGVKLVGCKDVSVGGNEMERMRSDQV
jgi:parallel beta-helix repeat protein